MGRDGIKLVGDVSRIERRGQHILVVVQEKLPGLDASGGVAHDCDVIRVNAVFIRIGTYKTHGARHINRALLLGIGSQAVVHDEGLEAKLAQMRRRWKGIRVVATEHERSAREQHDRAARRHALAHGDGRDIGAEVPVVEIAGHVRRELGHRRDVALLPEVESPYARGVRGGVQDGRVALGLGQVEVVQPARPALRQAVAVVVLLRPVVGRGHHGLAQTGAPLGVFHRYIRLPLV